VEPLDGCVATGLLSEYEKDNMPPEKLENAYIARVTVAGEGWPEIPLCVEPGEYDTIDIGDLSRPHFWWAYHFFHLVREITDDHAEGDQDFFATWQIGIGNDGVGPIDWRIGVTPGLSSVYPAFPPPDPDSPDFTWTGSLTADQYDSVGLADFVPFPTPQPLGFEVTRLSDSVIGAHATENRSFTLSVTTTDAEIDAIVGYVMPYNTPGPVTVSSFGCETVAGNGSVNVVGDGAWWSVEEAAAGEGVPLGTYMLTCTMTLSNGGDTAALYQPTAGVQAMQGQYSARYLAVSGLEVNSPADDIEPRDQLGRSTFEVWEAGGNAGDGTFNVDFGRNLVRRIVFLSANKSHDTTPPVIGTVIPSPGVLWPPNHKMVPVTVIADVSDNNGNATCKIVSITSNEPENGLGDGDTAPDWEITGDLTANLRAERSGTGTGRGYTINVSCSDSAGNTSNQSGIATVPKKNQR